jgi:hypothetical protein
MSHTFGVEIRSPGHEARLARENGLVAVGPTEYKRNVAGMKRTEDPKMPTFGEMKQKLREIRIKEGRDPDYDPGHGRIVDG